MSTMFFRSDNLLAPCDKIDIEYRRICFAYQYRIYLPNEIHPLIDNLIGECVVGARENIILCLEGLSDALTGVSDEVLDLIFKQ